MRWRQWRVAHTRGCVFVKIDPDVRELAEGVVLRRKLRRRGWRFSAGQIQFKNTAVTDLRPDAGLLLAAMKSKWRYNIRLAERRGIGVRQGGDDLAAFYRLYAETGERDGFLTRPFAYYRAAWETFLRAEDDAANPAGALLLAEHSEETAPVAGLFLFRYGRRAWYSVAPAANDAGVTCPTICCNGKPCAGRKNRAAPSMTGGRAHAG